MADERDNEGQGEDGADVREQDHLLPIANIGRIMKNGVPATAKISKDAKETVQECISEFISFVTSEANEKCVQEKRKTINGDDIIWALKNLGFDNYVEPLSIYLNRYKEVMSSELAGDMRNPRRKRDSTDGADDMGDGSIHNNNGYGGVMHQGGMGGGMQDLGFRHGGPPVGQYGMGDENNGMPNGMPVNGQMDMMGNGAMP